MLQQVESVILIRVKIQMHIKKRFRSILPELTPLVLYQHYINTVVSSHSVAVSKLFLEVLI